LSRCFCHQPGPRKLDRFRKGLLVPENLFHVSTEQFGNVLRHSNKRQKLHQRDLSLPALLSRLDRFDCLILDDLGYASKDQAETAVLFELIAERYERKSLIITCNQPF
jgi:DNA replication protein DnaC